MRSIKGDAGAGMASDPEVQLPGSLAETSFMSEERALPAVTAAIIHAA